MITREADSVKTLEGISQLQKPTLTMIKLGANRLWDSARHNLKVREETFPRLKSMREWVQSRTSIIPDSLRARHSKESRILKAK